MQSLLHNLYLNFIKDDRYMYFVTGFENTIGITVCACVIGIAIGLIIAIAKVVPKRTVVGKIGGFLADCYLTVIRGTPTLVQLLIIYFIILAPFKSIPKFAVAVVAFGINSGAYVAEIVRAGILAVDKGQMEAGRSLGLNYGRTMRFIILPQALKNILPALGNEFITLLKETSVAGFIGLQELTLAGDIVLSQTFNAFIPLLMVAAIYLGVVMLMTWGLRKLERRLRRSDNH
jgi:His/Glu/Gln/Arg/opine family amino acid ABC transporter permease subunit